MKTLLLICMFIAAPFAWGQSNPTAPAATVVKGEVVEIKDVEGFSYLRLKTQQGETWAVVGQAPVKKGDQVTIKDAMVNHDFRSRTLNKTFKTIYFGTLVGAPAARYDMTKAHAGIDMTAVPGHIHVAKAKGENAHTVEEIIKQSARLKGSQVVVNGKVVAYHPDIMGRNWIHLRDGSGSAADKTDDLLVTSKQSTKVGDTITARGIVRTDKDFGAGYYYKVLVEEATLQAR
jgi:hypothetical protein